MKHSFIIIFLFCFLDQAKTQAFSQCNCSGGGCYIIDMKHYHKIAGHPAFSNKLLLNDTFCNSVEFQFQMYVTADGSEASIMNMKCIENCCGGNTKIKIEPIFIDDQFQPIIGPDPDEYGEFTYLGVNTDGYNILKYKNPTKLPPQGELSYVINCRLVSGQVTLGHMQIHVYRPPVVMVHGLWSDASAFKDMETALINTNEYYPDMIYRADYSSTNASAFATNTYVVEQAVEQVINQCTNLDIACGKANVVCHSMGGLLTRKYVQAPEYGSRKDVNKIITCNTPHGGSQMANFLLDTTQYGNYVADALTAAGMNCYLGAVADLRVDNPNVDAINFGAPTNPVKVHAVTSEASPLAPNPFWTVVASTSIGTFVALLGSYNCGNSFMVDVFDSNLHDQIVAKVSQRGGTPNNATSTIFDQPHVGSVANATTIAQVLFLLSQSYNNLISFALQYNPVNIDYNVVVPCIPVTGPRISDSRNNPDVEILSPVTNGSFTAGNTMSIQFSSSMVDTVVAALRYSQDSMIFLGTASSNGVINLPIPAQTYGKKSVLLLGLNASHKMLDFDSISIDFKSNATLESISIYPSALYLNQSDTIPISIEGHYSDGIVRNLNEDDSLQFNFSLLNASRVADHFVKLDSVHGDTLIIDRNGVFSNTVIIHKVGINPGTNCNMVNSINNTGPGTLRDVIQCASENDTIYFDASLAGDTISLNNFPIILDKSIHLMNNNIQKIYIKSPVSGIFLIAGETNVSLKNMYLISENVVPSCISNFGQLTLIDMVTSGVGLSCLVDNNGPGSLNIVGNCKME